MKPQSSFDRDYSRRHTDTCSGADALSVLVYLAVGTACLFGWAKFVVFVAGKIRG